MLSYVITADGLLTAMHDTVPSEGGRHRVAIFNPDISTNRMSHLRLVNPGEEVAEVSIVGVDDRGESPGSEVTTTIPAGASRTFTAADLESGGEGLEGALGDGEGKWRLLVESAQPIVAIGLLSDSVGHLSNLSTAPGNAAGSVHFVPYLPSASDALGRTGVARVINHSDEAGEVRIDGFDDEGQSYGPVTLSIDAGEAVHFHSEHLESGTEERALSGALGPGEGAWRLELSSELDIEVLSYVITADGLLTAMHDTVPSEGGRHRVAIFNPDISTNRMSHLRLVNPGEEAAEVSIVGVDDRGESPGSEVTTTIPAGASRTFTAADLESGGEGLEGALGDGEGKWRLLVESAQPIVAIGLLSDSVGHLSNLSTAPGREPQGPPDLVVVSPSVSNGEPVAGATFTLSATVRNDGDAPSPVTVLRYYRSSDATITTTDREVGTAAVAGLAASASSDESVDVTAPSDAGPYYYGACVDEVAEESDTTNNCSTSVQVDVEEPPKYPDLEVGAPTVDETTPETGATFTLSATVSNAGDAQSAASTLRYYQSTDSTISSSDTQVGTDAVGALAASGTSAKSISLTAPSTAGTYYYGACVDAVTDESDTTNNCSSSVTIAVEEESSGQPDLRIVGVSAGTPLDGVGPGTLIQFSASVRNYGDANSDATTLRYYRSTDATISVSDTEVGTDEVSALVPSGQVSEGIHLTAPSTAGTYYYGACVDAVAGESDTTNNCSSSLTITVPEPEPDLVVGSPTVSDSSPTSGASFTLSATVRNAGGAASSSTTLRYYRSTDATITTSDTSVGTDAVAGLAASGSSVESILLTAPSNAGTYYYGACVDAVTGESDTTNNCSSSVTVTVPEPEPDLVVGLPTVSDSSQETGGTFTLSATVSNTGDEESAATTLRYYRSTDATITTSDTAVGTDAVGALAASGTSSESISLTAPATAGAYYYGACVDTVTGESDTTNNCSASQEVTVEKQQDSSDLVVASLSKSDNLPVASIIAINGKLVIVLSPSFTLSVTVSNTGDGESPATTLRYYRSTDATITTSDTEESTDAIPELSAAGSSSQSVDLKAPFTPGTYYYGACVDTVTGESDTTNNCSTSVQVTVPAPKPDLVVESPSVDDSGPTAGATFTLSATVRNDGVGTSAATTLRYYRSTDATIAPSDTQVGTDAVAGLALLESSSESVDLTAPNTSGTYYYGACVDAVTDESDTTDNCSSSVTVTVAAPEPQPDLIVDSFTITLGPTLETSPGALVILNQRVANVGDAASAATTVRYYRSTDATITTSDTQVSTDAVPELAASSRFVERHNEILPTAPGSYYYGACVDAVAGESNTANNCSRPVNVTVPAPQPDLVVSASVEDGNLNTGDSFTLSATVRNAGDEQSAASTLRYYRSTDSTISSSDTQVGTDAVGALAASGTSAGSISLTAPSTAGTYYYGACVDAVTDESDTTNNCSSSVTIAVEEESTGQPDLRVVGIIATTSPFYFGPGSHIGFSANIRNDGDANSDATTLRYYRSTDATISVSDTEVGTDEVSALVPSRQVVEGIDLYAPSTAGTYYYGACVDAVAGESDTANNCSGSLDFTVPES